MWLTLIKNALYGNFHKTEREREREKRKELNKIKTALLKILEFSIVHNKTNLALLWSLSVGRRSLRSWFLHPQLSRIPTPRSRFLAATWNQRRDLWAANFLPLNRYTCKSKHATQWKSHTRARARVSLSCSSSWLIDDETIGCTRRGGRCFEILDREFLATHRDFALIRYTFSFVSIERAIKRVFLRRLRLMEDWLRSFFAIGRIYLMADWPVNVDRWRNDPEYRSGKKCRTCFKYKLISLNWKKEKKIFFLLLRTFILLDSFCSLIILISPFFKN